MLLVADLCRELPCVRTGDEFASRRSCRERNTPGTYRPPQSVRRRETGFKLSIGMLREIRPRSHVPGDGSICDLGPDAGVLAADYATAKSNLRKSPKQADFAEKRPETCAPIGRTCRSAFRSRTAASADSRALLVPDDPLLRAAIQPAGQPQQIRRRGQPDADRVAAECRLEFHADPGCRRPE